MFKFCLSTQLRFYLTQMLRLCLRGNLQSTLRLNNTDVFHWTSIDNSKGSVSGCTALFVLYPERHSRLRHVEFMNQKPVSSTVVCQLYSDLVRKLYTYEFTIFERFINTTPCTLLWPSSVLPMNTPTTIRRTGRMVKRLPLSARETLVLLHDGQERH